VSHQIFNEVGKCPMCGKQFFDKSTARRHVREVHKGQKRGKIQNSNVNFVGKSSFDTIF